MSPAEVPISDNRRRLILEHVLVPRLEPAADDDIAGWRVAVWHEWREAAAITHADHDQARAISAGQRHGRSVSRPVGGKLALKIELGARRSDTSAHARLFHAYSHIPGVLSNLYPGMREPEGRSFGPADAVAGQP